MAYRRTKYRSYDASKRVARWMDLRYDGVCAVGGEPLAAGTRAFYDPSDRSVCCTDLAHAETYGVTEQKWHGSPVSGRYVTTLSEHRMGRPGAWKARYGRCEDAPCCGCCD